MKQTLILVIYISLCQVVFSQESKTPPIADSAETIIVENTVALLKKADSIKISDSINREVLRKQIEALKENERSKREKLTAELSVLIDTDSLRKISLKRHIDSLKTFTKGYPVIPYKDTIFVIYTKIGSITAAERANVIHDRVKYLYQTFFIKNDSLTLIDNGQSVDIFFKENIIISITELDALWYGQNKYAIAQEMKKSIIEDIVQYKKERSIISFLKNIGLALLVIAIQIALIKLINLLFNLRINGYIKSKTDIWFTGIKIKNYEILNKERQTSSVLFVLKIFRYLIIFILLYLTIPILFSIFPLTKRFAETMFNLILSPLKKIIISFIDYIPELITIIVIVTVTRYFVKFLMFLAQEIEEDNLHIPGFISEWAKPTFNILRFLVYAFMFIVIFPYLPGSDSAVFKGVSVFLGIVFSLGSSSIIGNMIAGIVITYMRPFKIGDRIQIGEVVGNVTEKTPFVTRIRTPKKEFITIPNSNVLSSNVINYSSSKLQGGLILHTTVTIGYDVPWRQVHQILVAAAKKTNFLNHDIVPFVLQTSLDDFYVSYQLNAHTNDPDKQPGIYSELHQNIQDGFNVAGIEILSPHYRAARDGNTMGIPKEYLPDGYKASGFKFEKEL
jgi:small-conductance mechanosensitive channel